MELFRLWVDRAARSSAVAGRLVDTAATLAAVDGAKQFYRTGAENGPGIGFALASGFASALTCGPVTSGDRALGDTGIALGLPPGDDPHIIPNATVGRLRR